VNHDTTHTRTDVAVVGGGLAGLTAAVAAARLGADVTLLDGRTTGGRARSSTRDGFTLNEGAHALYLGGPAWRILRSWGIDPAGGSPPAGSSRLVWDGDVVPLPAGPRSLLTTSILSTRSKAKLGWWFADLERRADHAAGRSVATWLDDERAGDDLRKLVLALMRLSSYTAHPEVAEAAALLRQLARAAGGVRYVDGGWQSIVDRLVAAARQAGVEVLDHRAVRSVVDVGGGWYVDTGDGGIVATSVVMACGGPAAVTTLLGADRADWVERAGPIQRAAVLDVGGPPARHSFLLSADEPLYLSTHAPVARLAPDRRHLVTLMRYLAADEPGDATDHRAALERHGARAGVVEPSERDIDRFLAAPVVAWGTPMPGVERPTGLELADRGLVAAGDWVGDHLLADAAVASGHASGIAAARRAMVAV
jgi:phytoene dehydrogenase-like protein